MNNLCVSYVRMYILYKKKSVYIRTYIHTYKKKTLFVLLKKKLICLFTRYRAFAQTRGASRIEQVQSQASKTVIV